MPAFQCARPRFCLRFASISRLEASTLSARPCHEGLSFPVTVPRSHASSFSQSADLLIRECTRLPPADLPCCRSIYTSLASIGLDTFSFAADHVLRAFSSSGNISEAERVFFKVARPTLYTWNSIVSAHVEHGNTDASIALYNELRKEGFKPDKCTFFAVLKACSAYRMISEGQLVHKQIIVNGLASVELLGITLVDMYVQGGCLVDADKVFRCMSSKSVVSWNVMISGYAREGQGHRALELYDDLVHSNTAPNSVTYACILKVCSDFRAKRQGMGVHMDILKLGLECDVFVGSAVLHMYAEFGCWKSAEMTFSCMPNPNVVSWNTFLDHYSQSEAKVPAFQQFKRMQQQGVRPDEVTCLCIVKYCSNTGDIHAGKHIFTEIINRGFESNLFVSNSVIDMYIKAGKMEDGRRVFDGMANHDIVSWNAMLYGYVEHGNAHSVFAFFDEMHSKGMKANEFTYACIVKACCSTGSLNMGMIIHEEILEKRIVVDLVLGNILVDMYAKCGILEVAHTVLGDLQPPNALSWNALISSHALSGNTCMVDECLQRMQSQGLQPNGGTLTSVLVACSHSGQLRLGMSYFYLLQEYGMATNGEHYNSLIDLYCRAGCLTEAEALFQTMPLCPEVCGRTAYLNSRTIYGMQKIPHSII